MKNPDRSKRTGNSDPEPGGRLTLAQGVTPGNTHPGQISNPSPNLITKLLDQGIQLWNEDGRLRFRTHGGTLPSELLSDLRHNKEEILAWLGKNRTVAPTSFGQQRLWFLDQLDTSGGFNVRTAWWLRGPLDLTALERATTAIVHRHETLRTTIASLAGRPYQSIASNVAGIATCHGDLTRLSPEARAAESRRLSSWEARRGFDLARGPLARALVLRLDASEHLFQVTLHHTVADGWSVEVFERELTAAYTGRNLPALPGQYRDFAVWQRTWLRGEILEEQLRYWKKTLAGELPVLELEKDRPRRLKDARRAEVLTLELAARPTESLRHLSTTASASLFMTLTAVFVALLSRLTGQDDVLIGMPVANRTREELEPLIGLFVNTLVLRVSADRRSSFTDLLDQVRDTALGAFAHQDLPFEKLVEALEPERELDRTPLFQVLLNMLNFMDRTRVTAHLSEGLALEGAFAFAEPEATYDVALYATEKTSSVRLDLVYRADLFDRTRMLRTLSSLRTLLGALAREGSKRLAEVSLFNASQRHQLRFEWSEGRARRSFRALNRIGPCPELWHQAPDAVAVVFGPETSISYGELRYRVNHLAGELVRYGVGAETRVGVCLRRSPRMVAAILAVWQAGGVYVPLDPSHPRRRLEWMIADVRPALVLNEDGLSEIRPRAARRLSRELPRNLAHIIYTSGSTGRPKGVMVSRASVAAYLCYVVEAHGLGPDDTVMHTASFSFDGSLREVIAPLLVGARLVVTSRETVRDASHFLRTLRRQRVDHLLGLVPSLFRVLLDAEDDAAALAGLRRVAFTGESLSVADVLRAREDFGLRARVVNQYGPTECTGTSCAGLVRDEVGVAAIGRPHRHAVVYVVDRDLRPVPAGTRGELAIGGAGLARGYLNRPAVTAEPFVPSPFSNLPGDRLYRTGDLVRHRADGELEILGRRDQQLKVRGVRIEPGEIEAVLARHPAVREAVVVARGTGLKAWFVPSGTAPRQPVPHASALRRFLNHELPDVMTPSLFQPLAELPRTSSGKVDRRKLAETPPEVGREAETDRPRSPAEAMLAEIWARLLGVARVGVHDHFFELGGHSLLATQVVSRVRKSFGVELPLRALFEDPTVARLAQRLDQTLEAALPDVEPISRDGELPLSFAQQRLWFLHRLEPDSTAYNLTGAWRLRGELDVPALEESLRAILSRHEVLRTTFPSAGGQPRQAISRDTSLSLARVDLSGIPEDHRRRTEDAFLSESRAFDLERGPLVRAVLLLIGERDHIFLWSVDHTVFDGGSWDVFVHELAELYAGKTLPSLPVQYADFAVWQRLWLTDRVLHRHLGYWRRRLEGLTQLDLPCDRPRRSSGHARAARRTFDVSAEVAAGLEELVWTTGSSLFMTLLAAFMSWLCRLTGQRDVVVGSPIANRHKEELEGLIGLFVNLIVLRGDLGRGPANDLPRFVDLVEQIRETALAAYAHQGLPFERLVEALDPDRDTGRAPVFQVTFTLRLQGDAELVLPGLEAAPVEGILGEARFDLDLAFRQRPDGLQGIVIYAADLFDETTLARWTRHFERLLCALASRPEMLIEAAEILGAAERHQLIFESNDTRAVHPKSRDVRQLFEGQVLRVPDAVAVVVGEACLSYRVLDEEVSRVARRLWAHGVGLESRVVISMARSFELVAAMWGVLRAGAAFVPADPAWPEERRAFLRSDSGATALINLMPQRAGRPLVTIRGGQGSKGSAFARRLSGLPLPPFSAMPSLPESLAYVIYTSGSTGKPKGVMVGHGSLANFVASTISEYDVGPGDRWFQQASVSFDAGLQDVFSALCSGACLVLAPTKAMSIRELSELLHARRVTLTNPPTSLWHEWADALEAGTVDLPRSLSRVLLGGEQVSGERLRAWLGSSGSSKVRLGDEYGPAEATIAVTRTNLTGWVGIEPSIGRPIHNSSVYVLDHSAKPLPRGLVGELCVGGEVLARGYLRRPRESAEKFVPDPWARTVGSRLYKTGDLARVLADGSLGFRGRIDMQWKVRGFRVEPGEIEEVLRRHPHVGEVAVVVRNARTLVAYVTGTSAPRLRTWLADRLPDFMVPSRFVSVARLPRLTSGKVDRRALLEQSLPEAREPLSAFVAPRTTEEGALAEIWSQILQVERVGVADDFFDLGGHSLLAVRLVTQVESRLGVKLPLATLLRHPTVEELALRLKDEPDPSPVLVGLGSGGDGPPFFCVCPEEGDAVSYAELSRLLDGECRFYALRAGQAEDLLESILAIEPHGPLLLGGWSMGGVGAFEVARAARGRGMEVALLALLDASDPHAQLAPSEPYDGRITLFRPEALLSSESDSVRGWGKLANGGVELVATPGDHYSMIRRPHAEVLARELAQRIRTGRLQPLVVKTKEARG